MTVLPREENGRKGEDWCIPFGNHVYSGIRPAGISGPARLGKTGNRPRAPNPYERRLRGGSTKTLNKKKLEGFKPGVRVRSQRVAAWAILPVHVGPVARASRVFATHCLQGDQQTGINRQASQGIERFFLKSLRFRAI